MTGVSTLQYRNIVCGRLMMRIQKLKAFSSKLTGSKFQDPPRIYVFKRQIPLAYLSTKGDYLLEHIAAVRQHPHD